MSAYFWGAIAAVCLISLAIVSRNWSCKPHRPQREERCVRRGPYAVQEVLSGNTLLVESGPRGRRQRTVNLRGIDVPVQGEPLAEESRLHLELLAGQAIGEEWTHPATLVGQWTPGDVIGYGGAYLQVEQLRAGLARCNADATVEYLAIEKEAKQAKRGIWATDSTRSRGDAEEDGQ